MSGAFERNGGGVPAGRIGAFGRRVSGTRGAAPDTEAGVKAVDECDGAPVCVTERIPPPDGCVSNEDCTYLGGGEAKRGEVKFN